MLLNDVIAVLTNMRDCLRSEGLEAEDMDVTSIAMCDELKVTLDTPDDAVTEMCLMQGKIYYEVTKPREVSRYILDDLTKKYREDFM